MNNFFKDKLINIDKGNINYKFLQTGDIFKINSENFILNQFCGNYIDGSLNNIYIRVYNGNSKNIYCLLGKKSKSQIFKNNESIMFKGIVEDIKYTIKFLPTDENIWFWDIELEGQNKEIDLIYGQDIGVGDEGGVLTNELYLSQYLGHAIFQDNNGYIVCSRQNQSQGNRFPYLEQGALNINIIKYSTDQMQFFGKEYKETNFPKILDKDLENKNYQYELSYIALQTEKLTLNNKLQFAFYAGFKNNLLEKVTNPILYNKAKQLYNNFEMLQNYENVEKLQYKPEFNKTFVSADLTENELNELYPEKILIEKDEDTLLSFFTKDYKHIILKQKELRQERPSGNIITNLLDKNKISKNLLTSTNYMYGLFNCQTVIGNTTMNKLLTVNRGLLNIAKNSGQRIYINIDDEYKLLTLPAIYEVGINFSKWIYKIKDDILEIVCFIASDSQDITLSIKSKNNINYKFLVTNNIVMGNNEGKENFDYKFENEKIEIFATEGNNIKNLYPDLKYEISSNVKFEIGEDEFLYINEQPIDKNIISLKFNNSNVEIYIKAKLDNNDVDFKNRKHYIFEEEYEKYLKFYKELTNNFNLSMPNIETFQEIEKLNNICMWYTHNALVHFIVPHGLEQSGGAAWGTRDVCQGPFELFMSMGKFDIVRNILKEVYSHQIFETKEWPQWFMFDKYGYQAGDCHGDVILWPLKCIADYLNITNDYSILDEKLCFKNQNGTNTEEYTFLEHIKQAIVVFDERIIKDKGLITYAGGDWDDTLQPASEELKKNLVSAWTQALAYQVFNGLYNTIGVKYKEMENIIKEKLDLIEKGFNEYLIKDNVIAGFACLEDNKISYMLHPEDNKTNIKYRLLPLTRSIIAELVSKEQSEINENIINKHLTFPDGIRLMDYPALYDGGVCKYFQRAEQASNVGREVSLQYVHAHIRYIEAMAKIGEAEKAFDALIKINPINIKEVVPNADVRQSNLYFSSSEGNFFDRYEYQKDFDKLKTGEIKVKGGWRLYSSGPGIYLGNLINKILGITITNVGLKIDPVLPKKLDNLIFNYSCFGYNIKFIYHISGNNKLEKIVCNDNILNFKLFKNKYRNEGGFIEKEVLEKVLKEDNEIHIYI